jgi:hypothetical protein
MNLGSLKLNAKCGINTFHMCLITHHTVTCKGVGVPWFCSMEVTTAEQAAPSVTMQQQCHLLYCKQSHDQNTLYHTDCLCTLYKQGPTYYVYAPLYWTPGTSPCILAFSAWKKSASRFACCSYSIHCTGRHRSWNTSECGGEEKSRILSLHGIEFWSFGQLACSLITLLTENVNSGTWNTRSTMRMHVCVCTTVLWCMECQRSQSSFISNLIVMCG